MSELRQFTSESVTEGHPDKICDQISDAVLDALLEQDRRARVAVETMVTTGLVHVAGEVTTSGYADIAQLVRDVITDIGYDSSAKGFDGHTCGVSLSIGAQSNDISEGVTRSLEARSGTTDLYSSWVLAIRASCSGMRTIRLRPSCPRRSTGRTG